MKFEGKIFHAWLLGVLALTVLSVLTGCGESAARRGARNQAAFQAGQQSGMHMQHGATEIILMGEVRQHRLLWSEGLTLSRAIVQAEYTGFRDPTKITVVRGGQRYPVSPKSLLRSEQDPLLEPGDVIEIGR